MKKHVRLAACAVLSFCVAQTLRADEIRIITFGSGGLNGAYHDAVSAICDQFNARHGPGLRCSPDPTPGSLYNLHALERGELDFALVQSDAQRFASEGTGVFSGSGPMAGLRSVLALYPEPLTLLVRTDADINSAGDLLGKRVDRGSLNSGRRATFDSLMEVLGLSRGDFAELTEHSSAAALDGLCKGTIDAAMLVIGHPAASVARVLRNCDVTIVPVRGAALGEFLSGNPDYTSAVIPASAYPGAGLPDTPSFSVMATIVTRADMDEGIVELVTRDIIDGRESLARSAPVIADLDAEQSESAGLTAPMHPGAESAFASQ